MEFPKSGEDEPIWKDKAGEFTKDGDLIWKSAGKLNG